MVLIYAVKTFKSNKINQILLCCEYIECIQDPNGSISSTCYCRMDKLEFGKGFNIHHFPRLHPRRSPFRPLRNPSRGLQDLHGPRRIHLPPYPHRRTSGRKRAWRTSSQTYDPNEPKLQQWQWCWTTCRQHGKPWPNHLLGQRSGADS